MRRTTSKRSRRAVVRFFELAIIIQISHSLLPRLPQSVTDRCSVFKSHHKYTVSFSVALSSTGTYLIIYCILQYCRTLSFPLSNLIFAGCNGSGVVAGRICWAAGMTHQLPWQEAIQPWHASCQCNMGGNWGGLRASSGSRLKSRQREPVVEVSSAELLKSLQDVGGTAAAADI